eukprot:TRINITY_DN46584_c0_g1_i1.p1 TRINITY_DN46584_c0_g1~~TRINITY_DN46584_c0_g1_i1.p1  ORF type:complete len:315 (-),score=57.47 TRINITY_DN46584_c0_g1_i1:115-1059(-)
MNIFFLHMSPKQCAKMHANIHVVKMIVETAQLLCNVHRRQREHCLPPYMTQRQMARIPYKESASGHRKLGSMIWVAESLGNYRWAVQLGLELCNEYNAGRGRAAGKTSKHKTQKVLEWLRDHEPNFKIQRRTPVRTKHLAMPARFKKAETSVQAYRDYYFSKRRTMEMVWPAGKTPLWWEAKRSPKKRRELEKTKKRKQRKTAVKATPSARKRTVAAIQEQSSTKVARRKKGVEPGDEASTQKMSCVDAHDSDVRPTALETKTDSVSCTEPSMSSSLNSCTLDPNAGTAVHDSTNPAPHAEPGMPVLPTAAMGE